MPATLLNTKLYIPTPRTDLVPRQRLFDKLNTGLSRKISLVSAPAGFGKSTLLSAWVQQVESKNPVAWLSLDEGDNDTIRFLNYLIAALQTVASDFGMGALSALGSQGAVNHQALLTTLINEIGDFPQKVILVLDDYHVIEAQPIDQALAFLIDYLPTTIHIVIATRMDPSWPLARLRARGEMLEIRVDDLRFTLDEATGFLNQAMGFDLSPDDVAALDARTEGWITGLQLAALSMQGSDDVQGFVRAFSGSNRYILDYLGEEVLSRQPKNIHDFLLKTSILSQLTGSLCDALTGSSDGENTLAKLEQDNLFIISLDDERRWYRYHHLFADLLLRHLQRTFPELEPELHQQASLWYEQAGNMSEAFRYARLANDIPRATRLLEIEWYQYINRGELKKLQEMLTALGPEVTGQNPILSMAYCWLYSMLGRYDAIPENLEAVRQLLKTNAEFKADPAIMKFAVLPSLIETIEATLKCETGNPAEAKDHALRALSLIPAHAEPATQGLLKVTADYWLALALKGLGQLDQACDVYLGVIEMMKFGNNPMSAANALMEVALMYQQLGRSQETVPLCEDLLSFMAQQGQAKLPPSGIVHLVLALAQADVGQIDNAQKNLSIGQDLMKPNISPGYRDLITHIQSNIPESSLPDQPLVEPLTERELEILALVADGYSNREISERLYLALSTVKGHNRNIFDKLQVQRRTEAVARARELGVL